MVGLGFSFIQTGSNLYFIDDKRVNIVDETSDVQPMVSVTMITYNHGEFIEQAIDGVLMQQTNFRIELIVGEDCSSDNTREILYQLQKKYPDKIILKLPESNLGVGVNSISNKLLCKGKYIAECEGDDYWTDPYKLQRQIDFLEMTRGAVAVCTNATADSLNNTKEMFFSENDDFFHKIGIDEIYEKNVFPTLTAVYNSEIIKKIIIHQNLDLLDWFSIVNILQIGDAYRLNFVSAHYRIHQYGVFSSKSDKQRLRSYVKTGLVIQKNKKLINREIFVNINNQRASKLFKLSLNEFNFLQIIKDFILLIKVRIAS